MKKRRRIDWNDPIVHRGVVAFCVFAALMILWRLLDSIGNLVGLGGQILGTIRSVLSPFIIGFVMAYLIYPIVHFLERLFRRIWKAPATAKAERRRAFLSTMLTFVLLIATVVAIVAFIVPPFTDNMTDLVRSVPRYISSAQQAINAFLRGNEIFDNPDVRAWVNNALSGLSSQTMSMAGGLASWLVNATVAVSSGFMRVLLGLFVSYYVMNERGALALGFNRLLNARLGENRAHRIAEGAREVNGVFYRFLVGRMFESFIVAVISFASFLVLGTKYSVLFAVINGVTNMVPYFGPLVGGVIIGLLTLLDSPDKLLAMVIILVAVQSIDAWVIGPRVLGDSVGLSPFWVLFGVTVGGGLFGIPGMFVGVPVAACLGEFLARYVNAHLQPEAGETAEPDRAEGRREDDPPDADGETQPAAADARHDEHP